MANIPDARKKTEDLKTEDRRQEEECIRAVVARGGGTEQAWE
jgi:hypothetical protein